MRYSRHRPGEEVSWNCGTFTVIYLGSDDGDSILVNKNVTAGENGVTFWRFIFYQILKFYQRRTVLFDSHFFVKKREFHVC